MAEKSVFSIIGSTIHLSYAMRKFFLFTAIICSASLLSAEDVGQLIDNYYCAILGGTHNVSTESTTSVYTKLTKTLSAKAKTDPKAKEVLKRVFEMKKVEPKRYSSKKDLDIIHSHCSQENCVFMKHFDQNLWNSGYSYHRNSDGEYYSKRNLSADILKQLEPKFLRWTGINDKRKRL